MWSCFNAPALLPPVLQVLRYPAKHRSHPHQCHSRRLSRYPHSITQKIPLPGGENMIKPFTNGPPVLVQIFTRGSVNHSSPRKALKNDSPITIGTVRPGYARFIASPAMSSSTAASAHPRLFFWYRMSSSDRTRIVFSSHTARHSPAIPT